MSTSWLTTTTLNNLINKNANDATKSAFLGIFASNKLPSKIVKFPILLIVNSDASNLPGRHWRAVYISKNLHGEIFDPMGMPINITLERWINRLTIKWIRTLNIIQDPLSASCGAFVLHFILHRLHEQTLHLYLTKFYSINFTVNENNIKKYMLSLEK